MKIIIDQYMDPSNNTQSGYLFNAIKNMQEHEILMYDKRQPLFEVLDNFQPDVYITSCNQASVDLPLWIGQSSKKVKLFVNISNQKQGYIYEIESHFKKMDNLNYTFFGDLSGVQKILTKKSKILSFLNAVDENIVVDKKYFKEKIDCLFFTGDRTDEEKMETLDLKGKTYHICSNKYFSDIRFDLMTAANKMFHNYKDVVFCNLENGLSQAFFESLHRSDKTYFISSEHVDTINGSISRVMGKEFDLNYESANKLTDFSEIKEIVKTKHLGTNRARKLLSQCN